MTFKKIISKVHLYLGLVSGLIVFILGITGCIYVFIDEIEPLVYADRLFTEETQADKRPLSQLLESAQHELTENRLITGIRLNPAQNRSVKFFSSKETSDNGIWYWSGLDYYSAYVNPYTSNVIKVENTNFEFFNVVVWLHWSLLLKTEIGQPIVGTACLIFVISLITGLILWWPKNNRNARRQRFWFRWKPTTRWKRKNYDLHNILGFYMMVFALLIALTGLVWAFEWFDNGVQWIANGGSKPEKKNEITHSVPSGHIMQNPVDKIYDHLLQQYRAAKIIYISIPQDSTATYNAYIDYPGNFEDVSATYDQYTGQLLSSTTFSDKDNGEKIRALNYDIHVGSILGLPGKILAFFASLVSASLPVTGFMIWWGRRKKKSKKDKTNTPKTEDMKVIPKPVVQSSSNDKVKKIPLPAKTK